MAGTRRGFAATLAVLSCLVVFGPSAARSASPVTGIASISVRSIHSCAVTTAGGVKCWGRNGDGQLGDGTTADRVVPTDVLGLTSGIAMVSAGSWDSCALTTGGGVKCWGYQYGSSPVDVPGLTSGVASISVGRSHACAVTTEGALKCWGAGGSGALGNGASADSNSPVDVVGLSSGVAAVSAGGLYTCALTTSSGVKCWGLNADGQLGDGTTTSTNTPVDVSGLTSGVKAIAVSEGEFYISCAVLSEGSAKCWGNNNWGALGNGSFDGPETCGSGVFTDDCSKTPVDVIGVTDATSIDAGGSFGCARIADGSVKCWGSNYSGQLGARPESREATAVDANGQHDATSISVGWGHTCVTTSSGGAKCWGGNEFGQLGDGTERQSSAAVDVVDSAPYPVGDVNCSVASDSVDAQLLLQWDARLIYAYFLPCKQNADVNGDGNIDALDAVIVLQYVAGLLPSLPVS